MEPQMLTSGVGIVILIFIIILSILWFLLPFAVFGIKRRLDRMIEQNDEVITLLQMRNNKPEIRKSSDKNERIEPIINL
ncbi:MAG: hypothetical protein GC149_15630 [Gammaproteobacteria bacterium]|nr:hypothetical protein [Gammaproteobacteria bacterium]